MATREDFKKLNSQSVINIRIRRNTTPNRKSVSIKRPRSNSKRVKRDKQQSDKPRTRKSSNNGLAASDITYKKEENKKSKKEKHSKKLKPKDSIGKDYLLNLSPLPSLSSEKDKKEYTKSVNISRKSIRESIKQESLLSFDINFKFAIEQERKRQLIISEMMKTEKTYIEFLQTVVMLFLVPLRKSLERDVIPLLNNDEILLVFQNIEDIINANGDLLKQMATRKRKSTMHWADILIHCWTQDNFVQSYQKYINGYTQARLFVSNAMKPISNPSPFQERMSAFAEFVNKQLSNDLCLGFGSLSSFLITPIQRLPRYLLYLKDLHQYTPETHPDREDVEKAYEILSKMTVQLDEQKLKYDEIYHLQALYQSFHEKHRYFVHEILDPSRKLITEGPLLECIYEDARIRKEKQNVLRYIILFSDILICATKNEDNNKLYYEWKINLYNSSIVIRIGNDVNSYIITERHTTGGFPQYIDIIYELNPFVQGPFSSKFWDEHFKEFIEGPTDLYYLTKIAIHKTKELAYSSLPFTDMKNFIALGKLHKFNSDDIIIKEGYKTSCFSFITEGNCSVAKLINGKQVLISILEKGQLFGEMSFLSDRESKPATNSIVAMSNKTSIIQVSYIQVYSTIAQDYSLERRFFHALCSIIANRFLKLLCLKTENNSNNDDKQSFIVPRSSKGELHISKETLSILEKQNIPQEDIIMEYPCKIKGKIGKGQLLICKTIICCFSRASNLFGHLSKTIIDPYSIDKIRENEYTSSLLIEYVEPLKHKAFRSIEIQFYSESNRKHALAQLSSFCGHRSIRTGKSQANFELTKEQWALITSKQQHLLYNKGDIIAKNGNLIEGIYQVVKGTCHMSYYGPNEVDFILTSGEIFGDISYILGTITAATLFASEDSTIVRFIPFNYLNKLFQKKPALAGKFYYFLSKTLRERYLRILLSFESKDISKLEEIIIKPEKQKNEESISDLLTKVTKTISIEPTTCDKKSQKQENIQIPFDKDI